MNQIGGDRLPQLSRIPKTGTAERQSTAVTDLRVIIGTKLAFVVRAFFIKRSPGSGQNLKLIGRVTENHESMGTHGFGPQHCSWRKQLRLRIR